MPGPCPGAARPGLIAPGPLALPLVGSLQPPALLFSSLLCPDTPSLAHLFPRSFLHTPAWCRGSFLGPTACQALCQDTRREEEMRSCCPRPGRSWATTKASEEGVASARGRLPGEGASRLPRGGAPGWVAGRGQEEGRPQGLGLRWKSPSSRVGSAGSLSGIFPWGGVVATLCGLVGPGGRRKERPVVVMGWSDRCRPTCKSPHLVPTHLSGEGTTLATPHGSGGSGSVCRYLTPRAHGRVSAAEA